MGKQKKVDIRKRRQRLLKEKRKDLQKKPIDDEKKSTKPIDIRLEKETKLYWIRALTAVISVIIGRVLFGLIGWFLFIWMLFWWFGFPFVVSFIILKYEYDKEEWTWKNIILPGIGIFFLLFMIVGILFHTILYFIPEFSSVLELFL